MKRTPLAKASLTSSVKDENRNAIGEISSPSRRVFMETSGLGAAATMAAGVIGSAPAASAEQFAQGNASDPRVRQAFNLRISAATRDKALGAAPHTTSGDEARYSDKSASYSKGLLQDDVGLVNLGAWASFKKALNSGRNTDYEAIILGGTRTLNGPQGSYCYDLECADATQFGNAPSPGDPTGLPAVPPFFPITGKEYGAQLVEQYWASMLRDVAFTDYANNATAQAAAAELDTLPGYLGPRDSTGHVTTETLFRGVFPGELIGPYISQYMITPTSFGQQFLDQLMTTFVSGVDYMYDTGTFLQVQNGQSTGLNLQTDPTRRYLHDGRGLGAWTHADVLFQAYLVALLVLGTVKAPVNPGNPYVGSKTQNGFSTFGGPDFAAAMGECAARALDKVWFQKWLVHLVHRPEAGGGVLHQNITNPGKLQAKLNSNVLNSQAVAESFSKYGTYLLPQAFPEGSPTHPCYPTGHGTVAGAAITMLKFFFDETYVIPSPLVPSSDGTALLPYTGPDAGQITVGGELNKLASNVSFGHGIHPGIHWRQSTYASILLGEAVALSMLQNRAPSYNEKFTVTFTKLDGHKVTISN